VHCLAGERMLAFIASLPPPCTWVRTCPLNLHHAPACIKALQGAAGARTGHGGSRLRAKWVAAWWSVWRAQWGRMVETAIAADLKVVMGLVGRAG